MQNILALASQHWTAILLIVSSFSFCLARLFVYLIGGFGATLKVIRPAPNGKKMNYLIPGSFTQGERAFEFLLGELSGGITIVDYRPIWGCSMQTITRQVIRHIDSHNYQAFIVGIAIGDYTARKATVENARVSSAAINPISHSDLLLPKVRLAIRFGSLLCLALTILLGWISLIPWCCRRGKHFSLAVLADQLFAMGFTPGAAKKSWQAAEMMGVITSQRPADDAEDGDGVVNNFEVKRYFPNYIHVEKVEAGHAQTEKYGKRYLEAWRKLKNRAK